MNRLTRLTLGMLLLAATAGCRHTPPRPVYRAQEPVVISSQDSGNPAQGSAAPQAATPNQPTQPARAAQLATQPIPGFGRLDTPDKIDNPVISKLLFPVNLAPDIAINTFVFAFRPLFPRMNNVPAEERGVWPLVTLFSPIIGPVGGLFDAWNGYPFWNPVALDPQRPYYNSRKAPVKGGYPF